jgi:hypothetical protein
MKRERDADVVTTGYARRFDGAEVPVSDDVELADRPASSPSTLLAASESEAASTLDSVSKLLGHSSIKITERHYAPWVKARPSTGGGGASNLGLSNSGSFRTVLRKEAYVSKLLEDSSIKNTERHYEPWVKTRQEQLDPVQARLRLGV